MGYTAPELLMGIHSGYSFLVDVWSFGCKYYELLFNEVLFRFDDEKSLLRNIKAVSRIDSFAACVSKHGYDVTVLLDGGTTDGGSVEYDPFIACTDDDRRIGRGTLECDATMRLTMDQMIANGAV